METTYVIGIDYGTDSCRALLVNAATGEEVGTAVSPYKRWAKGMFCDPSINQYRQHPLDYIESLEEAIGKLFEKCPSGIRERVVGIGFDTTGSTPVLIDEAGTPLALLPEYSENPNAMFVLWKDHTAIREADEINGLAKKWAIDYTSYSGGIYSSEWVWSKMLHVLRVDKALHNKAYSWVEHCDWMPALLTGNLKPQEIKRSRCAAGHKAMWNEKWNGLPSFDFLKTLDPLLGLFEGHLFTETYTSDKAVGTLTKEWADRLGLTTNVVVCVSELDCHMGAIGAQITEGAFVRVIGTSTCDIMVASYDSLKDKLIPGICGQVDGSVVPGMIGLEAGQSAFGDLYAWYKQLLEWPVAELLGNSQSIDTATKEKLRAEISDKLIPALSEAAAKIPVTEDAVMAIDWMNGRRTPDANQALKGAITELTLGATAPIIFKSLVEATAFGSKAIIDRFIENNIEIKEVIGIGGISLKSPFVMQTLSDVLNMPIKVSGVEQACALGAAMFASVAAGRFASVGEAQRGMGKGFVSEYTPDVQKHKVYTERYNKYRRLGQFVEQKL